MILGVHQTVGVLQTQSQCILKGLQGHQEESSNSVIKKGHKIVTTTGYRNRMFDCSVFLLKIPSNDARKLNNIIKTFDDHCNPIINETVERCCFFTRNQGTSKTIPQTVMLRSLNCLLKHATLNYLLIRDRIVCGSNITGMRDRLLREKKMTVDTCVVVQGR